MKEILIVASILVAIPNAAVIFMIIFNKHFRTFTNYFVLSLAVSDMLTGAVLIPLHIVPYNIVRDFFVFFILMSGSMNLCAVTWDRYIAVTEPFEYKNKLEKYHKKILAAIWVTTILFTLIPVTWGIYKALLIQKCFVAFSFVAFVFVPYVFIIFAYVRIWLRLRSHAAEMARMDVTSEQGEGARRASLEGKTVKVFLVVVSVFLISWLPVIYMTIVQFILERPDLVPEDLSLISLFTIAGSSLVNPILYALMKKDFNAKIRSMKPQ